MTFGVVAAAAAAAPSLAVVLEINAFFTLFSDAISCTGTVLIFRYRKSLSSQITAHPVLSISCIQKLYSAYTTYYFVVLVVQRVVTACSRFLQLLAMMVVREREISLSGPDRFL